VSFVTFVSTVDLCRPWTRISALDAATLKSLKPEGDVAAVGRKNWLFAGSFEGARRPALLYSLVQSCKLAHVAPFPYLKDGLLHVATHSHRRIDQLTPKRWAETFGPAVSADPPQLPAARSDSALEHSDGLRRRLRFSCTFANPGAPRSGLAQRGS